MSENVHFSVDEKLPPHDGLYFINGNSQNWAMLCGLFICVRDLICTKDAARVTCIKCRSIMQDKTNQKELP
jgi:hypothetical protein